jgi:hypothetical protein
MALGLMLVWEALQIVNLSEIELITCFA